MDRSGARRDPAPIRADQVHGAGRGKSLGFPRRRRLGEGAREGDRGAGRPHADRLPSRVAGQGRRRRAGPHRVAGAAGHGLRRARRACRAITGLYTSILCLLGYAVFGPSRILVLGPDSSLGPMIAATIAPLRRRGRRPGQGGRAGLDAGAPGRRVMIVAGAGQARLRRRPAVQADADRLHERPRADDPRRPAAEAVRVLRRRRRASSRRRTGFVDGRGRRRDGDGAAAAIGARVAGAASWCCSGCCPRCPACWSRWSSPRSRSARLRPGGARRVAGRGAAAGLPAVHDPDGLAGPTCRRCSLGALGIALVALADTISTASVVRGPAPARRSTATRR